MAGEEHSRPRKQLKLLDCVENNTRNVTCRRNRLGLSHIIFNKIMKQDLDQVLP